MTTAERIAFFAQYWGQGAGRKNVNGEDYPIIIREKSLWEIDYLSLRGLSEIDEEDIVGYLNLICVPPYDHLLDYAKNQLQENYDEDIYMVDYLRSRGFLLPFRNYSTTNLLNAGVVKLKGE